MARDIGLMLARMRRLVLALLVLSLAHAQASASGPDGHWRGEWVRDSSALAVTVDFAASDSGYTGRFSSDALRVLDIPFRSVMVDSNAHIPGGTVVSVEWLLVGDATTTRFEGALRGDTLRGRSIEGNARGNFLLVRDPGSAVRPYATEDVRFSNGPVRLAGSLLVPSGGGRHPAILFLHGSGLEQRFASRYLADRFARAGFVALIYDKRGAGGSTGDGLRAPFADLAADAIAGIQWLARDPRVRPEAIGIHGHSQGGTLAPLVARQVANLAFVICSAGSGVSMAECERYSFGNYLGIPTMAHDDSLRAAGYADLLVRTAYGGAPRAVLDSAAAANADAKWYSAPPRATNPYWEFSRVNAAYDPIAEWRRVRSPVLLVYGGKDERVPPVTSAQRIAAALRVDGNRDVTTKIFEGADHTLRIPPPKDGRFRWPANPPGYPDLLLTWAATKTQPRPTPNRKSPTD